MKHLYTFTTTQINKIERLLMEAKAILDGNSEMKIGGAKCAIDNALRELLWEDEDE